MTKEEIILEHHRANQRFTDYIAGLDKASYDYSHGSDKWNAGQQLDHILKSVNALKKALRIPKFALILKFGKANRPSRSIQEVVDKYLRKLGEGFKAVAPFLPDEVPFEKRRHVIERIIEGSSEIERRLESYSEKSIDQVVIPHPALGKMTLRELMYFAIHHADHHRSIAKKYVDEFHDAQTE